MARVDKQQPLQPSVLDRLLDNNPSVQRETPRQGAMVLREIEASVRRDLENLLNTRTRCLSIPTELTELRRSVLDYGIPDPTGHNLATRERQSEFLTELEAVIERYEPRFKDVTVRLLDPENSVERTLRFRIEATMQASEGPEKLKFDSEMEPVHRVFEVK